MDVETKDRQFVTALARGLEILKVFSRGEALLSHQDIVAKTRLPKATVSRLIHTLTELGYLVSLDRIGKYQLGIPTLSLGSAVLANSTIRSLARPLMQELARHAEALVGLGGRGGAEMVYLEACRSEAPLTLNLNIGSRIPLAMTAMGRAYLAGLSEEERRPVLDDLKQEFGKDWPMVLKGIENAIGEVERRGFCLGLGEWHGDINAVGVPLRPADGTAPLAFNCGGATATLTLTKLETDIGPRLVQLANRLQV